MSENRDNYYILLELPFNPPEQNMEVIQKAIEKKRQQWSKDQLVAFKKAKASAYLELLPDITAVMTDPDKRTQEAKAAKQISEGKIKELDMKLKLYSSKGDQLSANDLKRLTKIYTPYGFTEDFIRKRFAGIVGIPDDRNTEKLLKEVISKQQADNIRSYLRQLGTPYATVYEFLGLSASSSRAAVVEKAQQLKKKILESGTKNGMTAAQQSLAGLIIEIFKDDAGKRRYDNFASITRYGKVNDAVDELARSNKNTIDSKMKEALIETCQSEYNGVSLSDASLYIDNYCTFMQYRLTGNTVRCAHCNVEYPAGTETCPKCGRHIVIICPKCGRQNDNITKVCQCGFNLEQIEPVTVALAKAREAFASKKYEQIEPLLVTPRTYWPDNPDLKKLEGDISLLKKQFSDLVTKISEQMRETNYYTAKKLIDEGRSSGFTVGNPQTGMFVIDEALEGKVKQKIEEVEKQLDLVRTMAPDQAFETLIALSSQVGDCPALQQQLSKYPPEPVLSIQSSIKDGNVSITWKPSQSRGNLEYVLIRRENVYPNGTNTRDPSGREIYRGQDTTFTDSGLKDSVVYCYCVVTVRAGVESGPARLEPPVVLVDNVSDVKARGGDGIISLAWKRPASVSQIRLWTYCGDSQPSSESDYAPFPSKRLDGETVTGLRNGERCWIRIEAVHTISGKSYASQPLVLSAVPEKPASPMTNFQVHYADERFRASWDESEWDAILFHAAEKPDYAVGAVYDLDDIQSRFKKIEISLRSRTEADFTISFTGNCYIIPGLIRASNVVLGTAVCVSNVPPMKNPTTDINAGATELYVNFDWPKKVDHALLLYRPDRYPDSPEDSAARRVEVNRRQYDMDAGIIIRNPEKGTFYAAVYSWVESEGGRVYSDGLQFMMENEPQRTVYYSVRCVTSGFFSKKKKLTVTLKSDGEFHFPPFVIVGRTGLVPGSRDKGSDLILENQATDVNREKVLEYPVLDVPKGTKIRMFFLKNSDYKKFKIQNDGNSEL